MHKLLILVSFLISCKSFAVEALIDKILSSKDLYNYALIESGDTIKFWPSENSITIGEMLSRGGTKAAHLILSDEPGQWVILKPQKMNPVLWLQTLINEKTASDLVRAVNPYMAQEFKWVVIEKRDGQKLLTLAAKSFLSLAVNDAVYVFDHKNPTRGVFSRFEDKPFFSGITEELFFNEKFWEKAMDDLVGLVEKGLPKCFINSDSANSAVLLQKNLEQASSIGIPYSPRSRKKLEGMVLAFNEAKREKLVKELRAEGREDEANKVEKSSKELRSDENKIKEFEKTYGLSRNEIEKAWLTANDAVFSFERGDRFSFFLFDAIPGESSLIKIGDPLLLTALNKMFGYLIEDGSLIFFEQKVRLANDFKEKTLILKQRLSDIIKEKLKKLGSTEPY